MKTHKATAKRIKRTKTGKLMKRKAGQGHFNSREGGKVTRAKRRDFALGGSHAKSLKQLAPFS